MEPALVPDVVVFMHCKVGRCSTTAAWQQENNHAMARFGTLVTLIASITIQAWHARGACAIMIYFLGLIPQTLGPPTNVQHQFARKDRWPPTRAHAMTPHSTPSGSHRQAIHVMSMYVCQPLYPQSGSRSCTTTDERGAVTLSRFSRQILFWHLM